MQLTSSLVSESKNPSLQVVAPVPQPSFLEKIGVTVGYYYQFTYGVVNGTRFYGGPESKKCKQSLDGQLNTLFVDLPKNLKPVSPAKTNYFSLLRQIMFFPA